MNLDLEKAFKYPFQDKDWLKKCLIGSFFAIGYAFLQIFANCIDLISEDAILKYVKAYGQSYPNTTLCLILISCLLMIIALISTLIFDGYFVKNTNLRLFKPDAPLLDWKNFGSILFVSLKNTTAVFLYVIVFALAVMAVVMISILVTSIAIVVNKILGIVICILAALSVLVLVLAFGIYIIAATLAFKTDLRFATYFNFSLINTIIKKNFLDFFLYWIIVSAIMMFMSFAVIILSISIVGLVLVPFLIFYLYLIIAELSAQFLRSTLELNTIVE